jgi:serine/threonine protein kinase
VALTSGAKLGPYEIQSSIGAGGMGECIARDTRLAREVAIKVCPKPSPAIPPAYSALSTKPAYSARSSIPTFLQFTMWARRVTCTTWGVSELLEGRTLRKEMNAGPLSQRRVTEYAVEMARGLAAAHDKGNIHRDLKPDNVFITKDGRVKILDFGLTKQAIGEAGRPWPHLRPPNPVRRWRRVAEESLTAGLRLRLRLWFPDGKHLLVSGREPGK